MSSSVSPSFRVPITTAHSVAGYTTIPPTSTPAIVLPTPPHTANHNNHNDRLFEFSDGIKSTDDFSATPSPEPELRGGGRCGACGRGGGGYGSGGGGYHNSANSLHGWNMKSGLNWKSLITLCGFLVAGAGMVFGGGLGA
ncbi:hypothetical protein DTO021D3_7785 [Paecilomyces variotii]|nr:hypothetical protein DTO032I3_3995 [Paecilomyces variotii]KAJ9275367.1 hypothetical protein DTO021D3_7785 [Paecilomyces variotii]KAJ9339485.1 hypothetical protein DTO027B6_7948 [Paecilomyces variotii]KAJ9379979.1 hypothetical protein DTO032I4_6943 [Paecilomyces variotii]